jgi:hypothetical protein
VRGTAAPGLAGAVARCSDGIQNEGESASWPGACFRVVRRESSGREAMTMRMRDLVPWRNLVIDTSWAPEVAADELRKHMAAPRSWGDGGGDAPFAGRELDGGRFEFSRVISYRNSFLPVIRAVIEPSPQGGARVRVAMRLEPSVVAFMRVWMRFSVLGVMLGLTFLFLGEIMGLAALSLPVLGVALCTVSFAVEAGKAERLLREIFGVASALQAPPRTGDAYG